MSRIRLWCATAARKLALISAGQSVQPGTSTTLGDHGYGLVHHAMCLFTPPAFTGYSFQPATVANKNLLAQRKPRLCRRTVQGLTRASWTSRHVKGRASLPDQLVTVDGSTVAVACRRLDCRDWRSSPPALRAHRSVQYCTENIFYITDICKHVYLLVSTTITTTLEYCIASGYANGYRLSQSISLEILTVMAGMAPGIKILWGFMAGLSGWFRGSAVEHWSLTGKLSLSCGRPAADGWPLMWVNRPL